MTDDAKDAKDEAEPTSERGGATERGGEGSKEPAAKVEAPEGTAARAPAGVETQAEGLLAKLKGLDHRWMTLEARLATAVLVAEVLVLCGWVALKCAGTTGTAGAGLLFRRVVTSIVLGALAFQITKRVARPRAELAAVAAIAVGWFVGGTYGEAGVAWSQNWASWLESSSTLVLFGGTSLVAKRLTLLLAMLGASIATSQGKHISIDVVMRFLGPAGRTRVAALAWGGAALMCFSATYAFVDFLAVGDFKAPVELPSGDGTRAATFGEKLAHVQKEMGKDAFLFGRQLALDVKAGPRVLAGEPQGTAISAAEWNAWLDASDFSPWYAKDEVEGLRVVDPAPDARHAPAIEMPGGRERSQGLLARELNLVVPFGLFVIAVKLLLRVLFVLTGVVEADPNAAHADEDLAHAHDGAVAAKEGGAA